MFYFWHILRVINLRNHKNMDYGLDARPGRADCAKLLREDNIKQSGTQIKQAVAGESGTQAKIKISKRRQNENVKSELSSVNVNVRRERSGFAKNACAGRVRNAFPGVSGGVLEDIRLKVCWIVFVCHYLNPLLKYYVNNNERTIKLQPNLMPHVPPLFKGGTRSMRINSFYNYTITKTFVDQNRGLVFKAFIPPFFFNTYSILHCKYLKIIIYLSLF